ncbi:MAG: NAD(P)/FAD-dependent oxidoreductase, partial [Methyloceanibacter sp.]
EAGAFGGQAGTSARIENYLGFPTGISGQALAGRAFVQAQKFGARFVIPITMSQLDCDRAGPPMILDMADGWRIEAKTVVIASGARYRKLALPNLELFQNRGIWYWASPIEARLCADAEMVVVGGGNSAGQAAVFLSGHVAKVWMLVRGASLAESMSRYLVDRLAALPNVEVLTETEIVELVGSAQEGLLAVRWQHRPSGRLTAKPIRHVFLFIGAEPATEWLKGCGIDVDRSGFILTGADLVLSPGQPQPSAHETNVPGVFAVGRRAPRLGQARWCRDRRRRQRGRAVARGAGTWRDEGKVASLEGRRRAMSAFGVKLEVY